MSWFLTLAVLSIPHWLYAFVWTKPRVFAQHFGGKDPVHVFTTWASILKFVQFGALICWYLSIGKPSFDVSALRFLASVALIGFGQSLNIGIYNAIGKEGVYYGTRFGRKVPWYNGFPFTVVRHPQYVGSVLTIWGMFLLTSTSAHLAAGYFSLCAIWSAFYAITGVIEDRPTK